MAKRYGLKASRSRYPYKIGELYRLDAASISTSLPITSSMWLYDTETRKPSIKIECTEKQEHLVMIVQEEKYFLGGLQVLYNGDMYLVDKSYVCKSRYSPTDRKNDEWLKANKRIR